MPSAIVPTLEPAPGRDASRKLGVYVHFPWCLRKCGYCDFLSIAAPREEIPHAAYADAVLAELARRREQLGAHSHLASIFVGGGTPSLWEPRELGRVLDAILRAFPEGDERPEITAECNPSSFDGDRARALRDAGVNRVSLGVQSLDAQRLSFLGRLHDGPAALRAVDTALEAGFARVSADLIFGVAGQSAKDAVREALTLAGRGLSHLSAYALTIEPGTEFGALARKGRLPLLPEESVADSFVALDEALEARGLRHYEVSNYARPGDEARHNLGYWLGYDYLGLGCGAWGTVHVGNDRIRYRNTKVPARYIGAGEEWATADLERTGSGELTSDLERLSPETQLSERILLGLRLAEGFDLEAAAREIGVAPWPAARRRAADRLVLRNRLIVDGPRLRIPKEAWLFADGVIAELL